MGFTQSDNLIKRQSLNPTEKAAANVTKVHWL